MVNLVQHWGDRGLEAVRNFEKVEARGLSVHTFRKLGQVMDPLYLEPVIATMRSARPTVGMFTMAIVRACRLQWYTWHIMHPDLPVHTSRSVFL